MLELITFLAKLWGKFIEWKEDNYFSWGGIIGTILGVIVILFLLLLMFSTIKGCVDRVEQDREKNKQEEIVKKSRISDDIERGDKVKVIIQTKDGPDSYEGVFVGRYDTIIGIKTNEGKMAFGGSFVVKEVK